MSEIAPANQITWKGKSEEIKETSNELFIIFYTGSFNCIFGYGSYI